MAEAEKKEEGESNETAQASVKKSKKTLFIAAGVVLILLLAGIPATIMLLKSKSKDQIEEIKADAATGDEAAMVAEGANDLDELLDGEERLGAFFPLDSFVLNLSGSGFIRAQFQIEFIERDLPKRFYTRLIPIRDELIALITSKKAEELLTPQGKAALKTEIKELINEQLRKEEVKRVYFTQFVIQ
jgi:flagellar FliL protein